MAGALCEQGLRFLSVAADGLLNNPEADRAENGGGVYSIVLDDRIKSGALPAKPTRMRKTRN